MKVAALVVDALREVRARRLFWVYAAFAAALSCVAFALIHTNASIHTTVNGRLMTADDPQAIARLVLLAFSRFLSTVMLAFVLFGMGTVMGGILERGTAEVYLSKPVSRATVLLARVLGHWLAVAVALLATEALLVLIAGTRGFWQPQVFLSAVPILFVALLVLSVLALFNVLGASAGLSGLAALVVLLTSTALRYRELFAVLKPRGLWRGALDWAYNVWPKTSEILATVPNAIEGQAVPPPFLLWTTALFLAATLGIAVFAFQRRDY